ncbi:hypothetical protein BC629DRAFT_1609811 [Irpex lacteus]|nr:hypothetical protein BC629DRAFT_1609811 [Irpex lacteus]
MQMMSRKGNDERAGTVLFNYHYLIWSKKYSTTGDYRDSELSDFLGKSRACRIQPAATATSFTLKRRGTIQNLVQFLASTKGIPQSEFELILTTDQLEARDGHPTPYCTRFQRSTRCPGILSTGISITVSQASSSLAKLASSHTADIADTLSINDQLNTLHSDPRRRYWAGMSGLVRNSRILRFKFSRTKNIQRRIPGLTPLASSCLLQVETVTRFNLGGPRREHFRSVYLALSTFLANQTPFSFDSKEVSHRAAFSSIPGFLACVDDSIDQASKAYRILNKVGELAELDAVSDLDVLFADDNAITPRGGLETDDVLATRKDATLVGISSTAGVGGLFGSVATTSGLKFAYASVLGNGIDKASELAPSKDPELLLFPYPVFFGSMAYVADHNEAGCFRGLALSL